MIPTPTLDRFQQEHERLWELLLRYQVALMDGDLALARHAAEFLVYELAVHREVEDRVLLPLFVERGLESEGARLPLFAAEHDKLTRLAGGLVEEIERLERLEEEQQLTPRDRLDGIEAAFSFKHLFHHHTEREDAAMYPALGEAVGAVERAAVWERMDEVEEATRQRLGPPPAALPAV